jgi:hypothetical protein
MVKYGTKSKQTVKTEMHKFKEGKLTIGKKGGKVKSKKQAVAIGLSEARKKGVRVPPKKKK